MGGPPTTSLHYQSVIADAVTGVPPGDARGEPGAEPGAVAEGFFDLANADMVRYAVGGDDELVVEQDQSLHDSCGGIVWESAFCLAQLLQRDGGKRVRGKRVDRLSVSAVVDSRIELLLPKRVSHSRRWPIEPTTSMPGRCQLKPSTSISHRCLLDAEIDSKSLPGGLEGTQNRCQNDQGCSRATPGCPRSFEGRSGASLMRPGSVPRAPQGCPENAQRRPGTLKRPSKSAGKRIEAIQIDAMSVLGVKKSSFFARVTRKARSERHSVDFR